MGLLLLCHTLTNLELEGPNEQLMLGFGRGLRKQEGVSVAWSCRAWHGPDVVLLLFDVSFEGRRYDPGTSSCQVSSIHIGRRAKTWLKFTFHTLRKSTYTPTRRILKRMSLSMFVCRTQKSGPPRGDSSELAGFGGFHSGAGDGESLRHLRGLRQQPLPGGL